MLVCCLFYYCFQEAARKKESPDHEVRPYRGTLYHCWARLNIDGAFYYADLSCMAGYVFSTIDDLGSDRISELIPHEYVAGPDHGKREGNGFLYDRRLEAGGLEAQLEELQNRFHHYTSERHNALADEFDRKGLRRIYLIDRSTAHDPHMDFVFSDKTALHAVRFRHFMEDCRKIMGDAEELDSTIDKERQAVLHFLEQIHQDILNTFDPKVVKFRKKRKIILADAALKDWD